MFPDVTKLIPIFICWQKFQALQLWVFSSSNLIFKYIFFYNSAFSWCQLCLWLLHYFFLPKNIKKCHVVHSDSRLNEQQYISCYFLWLTDIPVSKIFIWIKRRKIDCLIRILLSLNKIHIKFKILYAKKIHKRKAYLHKNKHDIWQQSDVVNTIVWWYDLHLYVQSASIKVRFPCLAITSVSFLW